ESEDMRSRVVGRAGHKEAFASQKTPQSASDEKLVQTWDSAQVRRGGIYGHSAKLEGVTNGVIRDEGKYVRGEVQHHQMAGILLSNQTAGEKGEAGLHEEHKVSRV